MRVLAIAFLTLLTSSACQHTKSPFQTSYSSTSMKQISTLRAGDTVEEVIEKLGIPASVEVILPWLTYYAEDQKGSFYRVTFLHRSGKLEFDDRILEVDLTTGLLDTKDSVVVWPLKKEANQPPQTTPVSAPR
jgi:hypothetical protein